MNKILLCATLFLLIGCTSGKLRIGRTVVQPPPNAQTPSFANTGEKTVETSIPAGTVKETVKTQGNATESPKEVTRYVFPEATTEKTVEITQSASLSNERAPDQTVALRKEENNARAPLLYAAIGACVVGIGFIFMKWPTPAACSFGAGIIFFIAWQVSGLPSWFFMLGFLVLAAGIGVMLGFKRKEWDKNSNYVPDVME